MAQPPPRDPELDAPVRQLVGIGPARAAALDGVSLSTVRDLLFHLPSRYRERLDPVPIADLQTGTEACVVGEVRWAGVTRHGPRALLRVGVRDGSGSIEALFFNQPHLRSSFEAGQRFAFQGKVGRRGDTVHIVPSLHERCVDGDAAAPSTAPLPVYALPAGFPARVYRKLMASTVAGLARNVVEWRDVAKLSNAPSIVPLAQALALLHLPGSLRDIEDARRRLAYEEFVRVLLPLARRKASVHRADSDYATAGRASLLAPQVRLLRERLPFELTRSQQRSLGEIVADVDRAAPMHRLLHGDVGSGKTAVALLVLGAVALDGGQGALLVPTGILARQHAAKARELLEPAGVRVHLLTASQRAPERRSMAGELASGTPCVVVGTHAVLSDAIDLPNLRLGVVDEQHRFGVSQRLALRSKADVVDLLVMTATPIPRSLALTLYGDLDVSVIDDLPPGRSEVATNVVGKEHMEDLIAAMRAEVLRGGRVFCVCPLVEESSAQDLAAAEVFRRQLADAFGDAIPVALVHGRRGTERNEEALAAFRAGTHPVLVGTVVIEVGIDVPEATLMVVVDAQRFGLAALHQLRGRVGRSERRGSCVLVDGGASEVGRRRLDILAATNDGFEIAEQDLVLRGSGELYGLRQHGLADLRFADLVGDLDLLLKARADVAQLVADGREDIDGMLPDLRVRFDTEVEPGPG